MATVIILSFIDWRHAWGLFLYINSVRKLCGLNCSDPPNLLKFPPLKSFHCIIVTAQNFFKGRYNLAWIYIHQSLLLVNAITDYVWLHANNGILAADEVNLTKSLARDFLAVHTVAEIASNFHDLWPKTINFVQ